MSNFDTKAKAVPFLLIAGFTVQSGLPSDFAAIGVSVESKVMSLWVPAIRCPALRRLTENDTS